MPRHIKQLDTQTKTMTQERRERQREQIQQRQRQRREGQFHQRRTQSRSPMLAAMPAGRDVFSNILRFNTLDDMALLSRTGRAWRNFLSNNPPYANVDERTETVTPQSLSTLADCVWARVRIIGLDINCHPLDAVIIDPPNVLELVVALRKFPRLAHLELQLHADDMNRQDWELLFNELPRLTRFHLRIFRSKAQEEAQAATSVNPVLAQAYRAAGGLPDQPAFGAAAAALMMEIHRLQDLESLAISNLTELPSALNFSGLPRLPRLQAFYLTIAPHPNTLDDSASNSWFHTTPEQTHFLAQCKMLTSVRCGTWSLPWYITPEERADPHSEFLLQNGVARLTAQPLQSLQLDGALMCSRMWEQVSRMSTLNSLAPQAWYADVSDEQWRRLGNFRGLKSFALNLLPEDDEAPSPITTSVFLPSLLQCIQLTSLSLAMVSINRQQLTDICRTFPLKHLSLRQLTLESVRPLELARQLLGLSLYFCIEAPEDFSQQAAPAAAAAPVHQPCFRETLPALPELHLLVIHDREQRTRAQLAPLNAGLLARMPSLRASNLHENPLLEAPVNPNGFFQGGLFRRRSDRIRNRAERNNNGAECRLG